MDEEASQNDDSTQHGASAHLPRLFGAFERARASGKNAATWLSDAMSLFGALQKLGRTLTELIAAGRRAAVHNRTHDIGDHKHLVDVEIVDEIIQQLQGLIDVSPDAGELFFGAEKLDGFMDDFFVDSSNPSLFSVLEELGEFLDTRLSKFIERLFDIVFEDEMAGHRGQASRFERVEEFIRGLEHLLQEALDRWVLPGLYDLNGDEHEPK